MPTPTYDLIASNVLTSSASSVTFSSIPATYRDLVLVTNKIATTGNVGSRIRFNGDSGISNYSYVYMTGFGTTTSSAAGTSGSVDPDHVTSNTVRDITIFQVLDYSATNKHKSGLYRTDSTGYATSALAFRWANTAAINSIEIFTSGNQYASGSTFYLYGIVS